MQRWSLRTAVQCAVVALCWALGGCALLTRSERPPTLLLISLDGFRWDYCARYPEATPHLRQLTKEGVSARGLIPAFPSNTFPNHYSIVTGLRPAHHGIINNEFFDASLGTYFHYNQPASVHDPRWWRGEPIWVTAIKQGRKSACSYWVGSEVEIDGVRPSYWRVFDVATKGGVFEERLAELRSWLALPPDARPAVIAFYLEETNSVGHKYGPDSPELAAAVKLLDERVGTLLEQFDAAKLPVNVLVVSDHGMTPIRRDRIAILEDYLPTDKYQLDFHGPVAGLRPLEGGDAALTEALGKLPSFVKAYRTEELPARFHIEAGPRVPPIWLLPEEGGEILPRAYYERYRNTLNKADHGYDPAFESMRGILIAHGPSFQSGGRTIDAVENIHLYNLMCAALRLKPAPNDGDNRLVRAMLK
jgi:predicted AlkP superfamily pyrophosphatase or phosphodiesterase